MADNLPVTPGIGKSVRMDELPDLSLVQYIKVMSGVPDGTLVAEVDANGLFVHLRASPILGEVQATPTANTVLARLKDLLTGVVLSVGENHIGEVGSPANVITITPTISTTIYASGDAVGGIQDLANAVRVSNGKAILQSLIVVDKANQKKALTLLFFDSNPAAATVIDNAAFVFSTDISKLVGKVNVVTSDYESVNGIALANLGASVLSKIMKSSGGSDLYVVVITTDTPTYLTTADLTFKYGFGQA